MLKKVKKIDKPLCGEITIPADKSVSHRAIIFSSLAKGKSLITNFSSGADCHSTLKLFKNLGVDIRFADEKTVEINSTGKLLKPNTDLDAGNSGTTMRLVTGILAGQNFYSKIIGDESLSKRPMKRIIEPLSLMGAEIKSIDNHAPLEIFGKDLQGINYNSKLASAQVKSCVLLAGLNASGTTTFSEPYISRNHSELMLKYLGANIEVKNNSVTVSKSELIAKDIDIVGDISSAAFFIVAGLIVPNSKFIIKNVGINPTRVGIIDVVKRMNGNIKILNKSQKAGEDVADIEVAYSPDLKACEIQADDIPKLIDELPVIAVLASQANGQTVVKNAEDLRNKESDRIKSVVNELTKIGVDITETEDGFVINKSKLIGNAELESYHDHRLAMSFYVAGLICQNEISIHGFEWTKISFPEFEALFEKLS